MKKKLIVLFSVLLVAALLTGCGEKKKEPEVTDAPATTEATDAPAG